MEGWRKILLILNHLKTYFLCKKNQELSDLNSEKSAGHRVRKSAFLCGFSKLSDTDASTGPVSRFCELSIFFYTENYMKFTRFSGIFHYCSQSRDLAATNLSGKLQVFERIHEIILWIRSDC